ncbi:MAG: gamma-glutamylcyclotransferase [Candidatus Promineifilaceae bacterium]
MEEQRPFFVYGTLLPGQPNAHLWQKEGWVLGEAVLENGRLHDMGHYPMLVEAPGMRVQGVVLVINPEAYTAVLARLDALEGYDPANVAASAYRRVSVDVAMADGRSLSVWVYMGRAQFVAGKPVVAGGDWAAYTAKNKAVLDAWWQDVDSVAGLHTTGEDGLLSG